MSFRQRVNKIFGKTIFKEPEVSPTYRPDLVHGLEVLKDAINEKSPGRNLAPLVALIKAYGTKTPSTAQLKTIHYGTSIFNYIINQCGPYTVGFQEDEIERISQVANKAGEYFEIKYGRPCPKAVEAARRLAGTHPDSKKTVPSYTDNLDKLVTKLSDGTHPLKYPPSTIQKFGQAAEAIRDIARGHAPERITLIELMELRRRIDWLDNKACSLGEQQPGKMTELTKVSCALFAVNESKQNDLASLETTVHNLLTHMSETQKHVGSVPTKIPYEPRTPPAPEQS